MTIQVKRHDLWFGLRNKPARCPVARALNRATGDRWSVHHGYAVKLFERPILTYPLPDPVINFVGAFDSGEKVKPFSFEFCTVIGSETV